MHRGKALRLNERTAGREARESCRELFERLVEGYIKLRKVFKPLRTIWHFMHRDSHPKPRIKVCYPGLKDLDPKFLCKGRLGY